jgi:hypothetical protein
VLKHKLHRSDMAALARTPDDSMNPSSWAYLEKKAHPDFVWANVSDNVYDQVLRGKEPTHSSPL